MITARAIIEQRKGQGWADVDEMVNWLNPEDPARGVEKRISLARYVGYWHNNVLRGRFALPCLLCHDHFVTLRNLSIDRVIYGYNDQRKDLVNNTPQFFEEYLLPSNFLVADRPSI